MPFVKLDENLLDSTVWREDEHVVRVWIAMLILARDPGVVMITIPGLADRAQVSIEQCEAALEALEGPDKYSRTPEHEGRRIQRLEDGESGWLVLNWEKYRKKDHTAAERSKRYRERKKAADASRRVVTALAVTGRSVTQSEAEAEAESDTPHTPQGGLKGEEGEQLGTPKQRNPGGRGKKNPEKAAWKPTDRQLRFGKLIGKKGRAASTPWSAKELAAWRRIDGENFPEGDLELLEWFYSREVPEEARRYQQRTYLLALLNNVLGELDKASGFRSWLENQQKTNSSL